MSSPVTSLSHSFCLSIYLFLSVSPSLYVCLFLSFFLSFFLSVCLFLSLSPFLALSMYLSISLSVYLSPSSFLFLSLHCSQGHYLQLYSHRAACVCGKGGHTAPRMHQINPMHATVSLERLQSPHFQCNAIWFRRLNNPKSLAINLIVLPVTPIPTHHSYRGHTHPSHRRETTIGN